MRRVGEIDVEEVKKGLDDIKGGLCISKAITGFEGLQAIDLCRTWYVSG